MAVKSRKVKEFGDFQTPPELAREVCALLARRGISPVSVIEPTCGEGNFLTAALQTFSTVKSSFGMDVNLEYVGRAKAAAHAVGHSCILDIQHGNFFNADWNCVIASLTEPLLIIGNPPWVTNTTLSFGYYSNLPPKTNFQKHRGIDAITGKSNFDISEWMLLNMLEWIANKQATIAMFCKITVARKVLNHAWKSGMPIAQADIFCIDAATHFGVAVDACLLVITTSPTTHNFDCQVYDTLSEHSASTVMKYENGQLIANVTAYQSWKHLEGSGQQIWRSGIKHDCFKVMELQECNGGYCNGFGEIVKMESDYLYPMLKSSEIAKISESIPSRLMLVPQRFVGQDTKIIEQFAPKTWAYLEDHSDLLQRRASSIYRNRPQFSIFGVGEYSFSPWKVVVSGFYKPPKFKAIGSLSGKPIVLDDTCYFLPCQTQKEATAIAEMLNSEIAQEFYSAFVFPGSKRPITADLLRRLDLLALSQELNTNASKKSRIKNT